ncbi:uncharacterized protein LOC117643570 [Thrips palmi]|uniref:Uncharacterized protein LOC117643570 n=1 Tax=Thrips palmi TaxID=161013 RepID=A0A6P8YMN0_THRPL|nr:uncharacterized protein LOC117643570 [Thrips palmi]
MNVKVALFLAVVAVVANVAAAASACNPYPFGYGYQKMGDLFTTVKGCLNSIQETSDKCAYAAISGMIEATLHEPYANSDQRKTVRFVSQCLRSAKVAETRITKAEECLVKMKP